jgi:APA family basic amino acid/polyamine antiporter
VHPKYGTPGFSILAQGIWAGLLLLTGSYETLIDYALFGIWVFYGLMIGAVMVLRKTQPNLPRPYRMWGYPVTPVIFLAITVWFLGNMLVTRPGPAWAGLGLMLTGVPAYFLWQRFGTQTLVEDVLPEAELP